MTATLDTATSPATSPDPPGARARRPTTPGPGGTATLAGRTAATAATHPDTRHRPAPAAPSPGASATTHPGAVAPRARPRGGRRRAPAAPPGRPSRPRNTRRPPHVGGHRRPPPPPPPPRAALPPSRPAQLHDWFAARLLAVLSGQRPVHSMLGHTRGAAYDQLVRLAPRAPLRPTERRAAAPTVHRVGVFQPRPGAVEVFARILSGSRLRAMAFRLEFARSRRWVCAAVELDV